MKKFKTTLGSNGNVLKATINSSQNDDKRALRWLSSHELGDHSAIYLFVYNQWQTVVGESTRGETNRQRKRSNNYGVYSAGRGDKMP